MKVKFISKIYVVLFLIFMYVPIFVLITFSFNQLRSRSVWTKFTFEWYNKLLHNQEILHALLNTLIIAFVASIVATVLGTVSAVGIHFLSKKWRSIIVNITCIPIINPEIVTGVSLMLLFTFLKIKMGFTTLILAHIAFNVPYVVLNVLPKLKQMNMQLCYAAMDLGCNLPKVFLKVILPEISYGIISGFLISVAFSVDDFVISYFTSGPTSQTLPLTIFSMTRRRISPEINALSTIIFVIILLIILAMNFKNSKKFKKKV